MDKDSLQLVFWSAVLIVFTIALTGVFLAALGVVLHLMFLAVKLGWGLI